MNKAVRKILGALSAATLILSGSLPLMGAEVQEQKPATEVQKVAPKPSKSKPAVRDKKGELTCGAGMEKKPVDDKKIESKCAGKKPTPPPPAK